MCAYLGKPGALRDRLPRTGLFLPPRSPEVEGSLHRETRALLSVACGFLLRTYSLPTRGRKTSNRLCNKKIATGTALLQAGRERERRPPVAAVTLPPRSRGGRTRGGLSCFDSSHFTSFLSLPPPLRPRKGIKKEKGKARLGRIHYLSARSLLLLLLSPAAGVRRRIPLDPCIARQARPHTLGLSLPRKEEKGDLTTEGAHTTRLSLSPPLLLRIA